MKTVFCKFMIIVLCLLFPLSHSLANPLQKQGVAAIGQSIDLGIVSIPWSRANKRFGYIYPVKGLSIANINTGPQTWKTRAYKSYKGERAWDQINDPAGCDFSSPNVVVCTFTETKPENETFGGILVFQHKNHTGAVEFLKMDSAGVHYKYEIFSTESDSPVITEETEPAIKNFDEARTYEIRPDNPVPGIHISNNASVVLLPGSAPIDSVSISKGTLTLKGPGDYILGDVKIHQNGAFRLENEAVLHLTGDWDNTGEFDTFSGSVVFDGDSPQTITGETSFNSLLIDTSAQVIADLIHVNDLYVLSGIFTPGTQSQIHHASIFSDGVILPEANGRLYFSGNIYNEGGFIHNRGRVILNGTDRQYIRMGYYPFNTLDIENPDVYWETPRVM